MGFFTDSNKDVDEKITDMILNEEDRLSVLDLFISLDIPACPE